MACNIYEEPRWTLDVRNSKGVQEGGGEREERLVDIYERSDALTLRSDREAAVRTNPFRAAALILGLLCLLLLVGITVLLRLYIPDILRRNATALRDVFDDVFDDVSNSSRAEKVFQMCKNSKNFHLQDGWVGIGYHCYFKSKEMKNWTESRTDCQSKGADLLIINAREEQEFVKSFGNSGAFWIGLQAVTTNHWGEQWKWVDNSAPSYLSWRTGVSVNAIEGAKVYIDLDGNWNYVNNGSKHWICEKPMN